MLRKILNTISNLLSARGMMCKKSHSSFLQENFSYFPGTFLSQSHSGLSWHALSFGTQVIILVVLPTSCSEAKNVSEAVGVSQRQQETESDICRQTVSLGCGCGPKFSSTHTLTARLKENSVMYD